MNEKLLQTANSTQIDVSLGLVQAAEMDDLWSFVQSKQQQRWLWHAIDHATGKVLAYVLAPHEDAAFVELKTLLKPFGITRFFTDGWGAYQRHLDEQVHIIGKSNTQTIERKHKTIADKD